MIAYPTDLNTIRTRLANRFYRLVLAVETRENVALSLSIVRRSKLFLVRRAITLFTNVLKTNSPVPEFSITSVGSDA